MLSRTLAGYCVVVLCCLAVAGCAKKPDQMSKAEFEGWLKQEMQFSEISLTEQRPGYFTGKGKTGGRTYQLVVTRQNREVTWEATAPGGDEVLSGSASW
jgi:hypothetical protein